MVRFKIMGLKAGPERVSQTWYKSCVFLDWGFLLVPQEDMFYCGTRRHVFLCHKKTCILVAQTESLLVPQENMSSSPKNRNPEIKNTVFLTFGVGPIWDPQS